jgi:hypothetical protein
MTVVRSRLARRVWLKSRGEVRPCGACTSSPAFCAPSNAPVGFDELLPKFSPFLPKIDEEGRNLTVSSFSSAFAQMSQAIWVFAQFTVVEMGDSNPDPDMRNNSRAERGGTKKAQNRRKAS